MDVEQNYAITGEPTALVGAPYLLHEVELSCFKLARRISPTSDGAGFIECDEDIELFLDEDIVENEELSRHRILRVKKQNYGLEVISRVRKIAGEMRFPYFSYRGWEAAESRDSNFYEIRLTPRFFNLKFDTGIDYDFLHCNRWNPLLCH